MGGLLTLHHAHLHRARLGAEQHVAFALYGRLFAREIAHVEGVLQSVAQDGPAVG